MSHGTRHLLLMALACIVPMLFILLLPAFGMSQAYAGVGIAAMIVAHLILMRPHKQGNER